MLKRLHFIFGVAILLVFVLTGQYMDRYYDHLREMEPMNRALFRAGHIYILLFGLINVAIGAYLKKPGHSLLEKGQWLGSLTMVASTLLIVCSFFTELPAEEINRPLARYALYLILAGVSIHGLVSLGSGRFLGERNHAAPDR